MKTFVIRLLLLLLGCSLAAAERHDDAVRLRGRPSGRRGGRLHGQPAAGARLLEGRRRQTIERVPVRRQRRRPRSFRRRRTQANGTPEAQNQTVKQSCNN